jgi:hypothetical protein
MTRALYSFDRNIFLPFSDSTGTQFLHSKKSNFHYKDKIIVRKIKCSLNHFNFPGNLPQSYLQKVACG